MNNFSYEPKPLKKLRNDYNRRNRSGLNSFKNFDEFLAWYKKQKKECYYCGLKETELQEIVMTGLLKSKRFPQNGVIGRGKSRGVYLEIDRKKSDENYSSDNCVLACYFCNNDKSDIFDSDSYKRFQSNRSGFIQNKLTKK